jgi:hypothetical protein
MTRIEELGHMLILRFLVGYLALVLPLALLVSVTLPLQCPLWEVFAIAAAFACALSLLFALTSVAYEAAADAVSQSCSLFDQLGAPARFPLHLSPCQP